MSKRRAGDTLTGGTHDVNPQVFTLTTTQTGNDVNRIDGFPTPIPRFTQPSGRTVVMEILKVYFVLGDIATPAANTVQYIGLATSATTTALPGAIQDPRTFAFIDIDGLFATAVGFAINSRVREVDLTDSAGHGYLVATDSIFLQNFSASTGAPQVAIAKILYRQKEIGLPEYIGIVQSQQS